MLKIEEENISKKSAKKNSGVQVKQQSPKAQKLSKQQILEADLKQEKSAIFDDKNTKKNTNKLDCYTEFAQNYDLIAPKVNKLCFEDFAKTISLGIEFEHFHTVYYRLLEYFARGEIRRLIITMPPQHGKSLGATTLLPAYMLGLNPNMRIAIASYSASLAHKFNRRIQRILESNEYRELFPDTTIKGSGSRQSTYIRTSEEVEIIGHEGSLLSVGREGSLTGNRVDCFILDDLYKDAMEANSPLIRENCLEWYTSVVKTRMHNDSSELIVFTRWHEEDLIGTLTEREPYSHFSSFDQLENANDGEWIYLNFEAIKTQAPSVIDPRSEGEALWPSRQSVELLLQKRSLDPVRFECMYQGNPSTKEGLLYGSSFKEYSALPEVILRRENYTDTADLGDDYLCSVCYAVGVDGAIYVTDMVYTREAMELSEPMVAQMLIAEQTTRARIESNNGGRGFARAVQSMAPRVKIEWFHQSANKQARILSNSATVMHTLRLPQGWQQRWPDFAAHISTYRRDFKANRWHDAADVLTGIIEQEAGAKTNKRTRSSFV